MYDYKPIDRHITLNENDSDLFPIRIDLLDLLKRTYRQYNLPEPDDFPPFEQVCGYGIRPEDQVWEKEVIPESLVSLERKIRNDKKKEKRITAIKIELSSIDDFWNTIEENPDKWASEIEWIRKMWEYRLLGKFIFINGKVHYLTGAYHYFLNWYVLDDVRPEYRLWDNLMLIGWKFAQLDTTTFANIDPATRKPVPNDNGEYEMIDTGRRVCLGVVDAKSRRVGDTSKSQCWGMEEATRSMEHHFATQGRDEAHAKKVFQQQFMRPFSKVPLFFKSCWDSSLGVNPKEHILFDGESLGFGLHSRVTHALSANAENYNGDKLNTYHRDEAGSTMGENVNIGHAIIKHCLTLGDKIIGFCMYSSTVDKIETGSAGENFMSLCFDSHYDQRDDNGRTASGMYNIFIPAELRLEGFIDKYGNPVTGTPTPEQARFIGKEYGSIAYLDNTLKALNQKKDYEASAVFERQYPRKFRDAFSPPSKNAYFPVDIIRNRIQHLQFVDRTQLPVRGDFVWSSGFGSDVVWVPNDQGRWFKSREFSPGETNQKQLLGGVWYPKNDLTFVHSADSFGQDRVASRASMGAIACRWMHDISIDPTSKDLTQWNSARLIITYKNRPATLEEFCEDVLKQNLYVGGKCYPERNKADVLHYYRRNGYEGYLLYDCDRITGAPKAEAGFWTKDEMKQRIFNLTRDELVKHGARCQHIDWLQECADIRDPSKMTDFDLFTAVSGTLLAEQNPYFHFRKAAKTFRINTSRFIREEEY